MSAWRPSDSSPRTTTGSAAVQVSGLSLAVLTVYSGAQGSLLAALVEPKGMLGIKYRTFLTD